MSDLSSDTTPAEYWSACHDLVRRHGSEKADELRAEREKARQAGIADGGPSCCGTTGIYHRPWCHQKPRHHSEER